VGLLGRFDQVIVGRNRTRWDVIRSLRAALGQPPGRPVRGDRVMVLRNDPDLDVVNGQQATVAQADPVEGGWLLQTTCGKAWLVDERGFLGQEQQEAVKVRSVLIGGRRCPASWQAIAAWMTGAHAASRFIRSTMPSAATVSTVPPGESSTSMRYFGELDAAGPRR
jgi:hypothetical protein